MGSLRAKRLLKNAVYRSLGEAATRLGGGDDGEGVLRVLMYHKVNDRPGNTVAVPTRAFAEQMAQLRELRYEVVALDAVLEHYLDARPLPPRSVLLTFDDGYRDNLENALPVLQGHGYPAVLFAPVGFVGARVPLPHDEAAARSGLLDPILDWGELRELDAAGVRVESHGISHVPLARLSHAEARRELSVSKHRLEEGLGRPVRAFAFAKGSLADFRPVHVGLVRAAGYDLAFTTVSGPNRSGADRFRLRRYNVEPYSARTFELVLGGACDAIALKDTVVGTRARRAFNAALGTASK